MDNLDTYFKSLQQGIKPLQIKHGFLHRETSGSVAIDQKGGGPNLAQTRLYVYADVENSVLHVITIGDKRSQKDDNRLVKKFVEELKGSQKDGKGQPAP